MRLSQTEIATIKQLAKKHFGQGTIVFLFGSRTDNSLKGGDIDLFIRNSNDQLLNLETKIHFLAELKTKIGEQKIDVVFDNSFTKQKTNFYNAVNSRKIEL